ncbi:MAG: zinc ribbon domain-containing protein, partial [bacterium]
NELENLSSRIEILDENRHKKEQELTEKIKITEHEHQSYEKRRQDLISHIKKPILYQYERIRRVKGKTAVVEINKYACGGCFATIPPQKKVEIRHMDQLILCESCGRILVSKNENEVVTT